VKREFGNNIVTILEWISRVRRVTMRQNKYTWSDGWFYILEDELGSV